jgi:hypothetical protein
MVGTARCAVRGKGADAAARRPYHKRSDDCNILCVARHMVPCPCTIMRVIAKRQITSCKIPFAKNLQRALNNGHLFILEAASVRDLNGRDSALRCPRTPQRGVPTKSVWTIAGFCRTCARCAAWFPVISAAQQRSPTNISIIFIPRYFLVGVVGWPRDEAGQLPCADYSWR